jgi:hypothetical protein
MKKLIAATLIAFALSTPAISTQAMAFDLGSVDGIPSDMKDMIAKQSGGRVTNKQGGQQSGQQGQQQAGQDGQQQQQGGRQARKKKLSKQEQAMQSADKFLKGDSNIGQSIGQGEIGSLR